MLRHILYYAFCMHILHLKYHVVCTTTTTSIPGPDAIPDEPSTTSVMDVVSNQTEANAASGGDAVLTTPPPEGTVPASNESNAIPLVPTSEGGHSPAPQDNATIANETTTPVPATVLPGEANGNQTSSTDVLESNTEANVTDNTVLIYVDETTFHGNMNSWNFNGMWGKGKYNLNVQPHMTALVPDITTSKDKEILLTMDTSGPYLEKEFPPLLNGSFSLTCFVNCSKSITIKAEASTKYKTRTLFVMTEKELENVNLHWFTSTYAIERQTSPFKVKLIYQSSDSRCAWAVDVITVRGIETNETEEVLTPAIPVIPEAPTTTTIAPDQNVTETTLFDNSTLNATVLPEPPTNVSTTTLETPTTTNATNEETTAVPPAVTEPQETTSTTSADSRLPETVKEMAQIASTMWDAFYVFLALFIACILALIVLIVRQRRSREEPNPPTVEAYSPRASTHQLEKSRDNNAYETDTV